MKLVLFYLLLLHATSQVISLTLGSYIPNRITSYKWIIRLADPTINPYLSLYFDPNVVLMSNCRATVNGIDNYTWVSNPMHLVQINSDLLEINTIIVSNVRNPPFQMQSSSFYYQYASPQIGYAARVFYKYENSYMYFYGSGISLIWMILIFGRYIKGGIDFYPPYCMIFLTSFAQTIIYMVNTFCRYTAILYLEEDWQRESSSLLAALYIVGGAIVVRNLYYFIHFMIYIRPKVDRNIKWNYAFCNITAVIAALTSFEVGYLPYSKALSLPSILIKTQSQLTLMHKLSIINLVSINITLIIISVIGAIKSELLGNNFLLFLDLATITLINSLLTIFFLVKPKPESYYKIVKNEQSIIITEAQLNEKREKDANTTQFTGFKQSEHGQQQFKWMVLSIDF